MAERFNPHRELSAIFTELWELDENRLKPGDDYNIDLQGYTKVYKRTDRAENPLFAYVNPVVLQKPTFKSFIALLDNYESSTGVSEEVTPEEERENMTFIDNIMKTKVMKKAHKFLVSQYKSDADEKKFKQQLYKIWFTLYRRTYGSNVLDSSGFEHVFVGETRNSQKVIGFHNWIQFYLQEKCGNVDYQGYIKGAEPVNENSRLISIQFKWKAQVKPVGSTFIGTSPEFEFALYTIIFLCSPTENTDLNIAGQHVIVTCYRFDTYLGTSFPKCPR